MSSLNKRLEVMMATGNDKYWKWVLACKDADVDLNEWETTFINNIYDKMKSNIYFILSPSQKEHLERIYAEKTK